MTLVRMLIRQAGRHEAGDIRDLPEVEAQRLMAAGEAAPVAQRPAAVVDGLTPPARRVVRRGPDRAETASVAPPAERRD